MNIFSPDARFISGLGDMGYIGTIFFSFFGPLITFGLFIWFTIILVQNIVPIARKSTPPAEKDACKKALMWWGISLFVSFAAMLIVTTLFFSLGHQIAGDSSGGGEKTAALDGTASLVTRFKNTFKFKGII